MSIEPTRSQTFHEYFNQKINDLRQSSERKVGETSLSIGKKFYNRIVRKCCNKYNNSIYSIQTHDRRVVARAYKSYMKSQSSGTKPDKPVNKGTINQRNFNSKILDPNFIEKLKEKEKGKDLDAFTALLPDGLDFETLRKILKKDDCVKNIPLEVLQTYIQKALNQNNEPLAKELIKQACSFDQDTFKQELSKLHKNQDPQKNSKNTESLVKFFNSENFSLQGMKSEILVDAVRNYNIKFITQNGKEITINKDHKFQNKKEDALEDVKKQIKEQALDESEIRALADFIANGCSQSYLNIQIPSILTYVWEGKENPIVTAKMTTEGLDVQIQTKGRNEDEGKGTKFYTGSKFARVDHEVDTDVTFHYKGSIGEAEGRVDRITVNKFESKIENVEWLF